MNKEQFSKMIGKCDFRKVCNTRQNLRGIQKKEACKTAWHNKQNLIARNKNNFLKASSQSV